MQSENKIKIANFINICKDILYKMPLIKAVTYAEELGLLLRSNQLGVYSLNDVEVYLVNQVALALSSYTEHKSSRFTEYNNDKKILFIATELYQMGGHTRLMERLATFLDEKPDLLLSKMNSDSITSRMKDFFADVNECENFPVFERILFILKKILMYDVIVLNVHPEDIYTIIACGVAKKINKKIQFHFVNHADHTFSYGSSVANVWYEISSYGRSIDIQRKLTANKCFLGIPIDNVNSDDKSNYSFKDGDLILTAASGGKYKPDHGVSIIPLISNLLDKYQKSNLQVVGADLLRDYWWWRAKVKYGKRLIISGSLPYQEYLNVTSAAKLYIDSHPFPGGTAFAEQFLKGRLCTGLVSKFNGYTPAELFKYPENESVLSFVENISVTELNRVKDLVLEMHGYESVRNRFNNSIFKNVYSCNYIGGNSDKIDVNTNNFISCIPSKFELHGIKQLKYIFLISKRYAFVIYLAKRFVLKTSSFFKRNKFIN